MPRPNEGIVEAASRVAKSDNVVMLERWISCNRVRLAIFRQGRIEGIMHLMAKFA